MENGLECNVEAAAQCGQRLTRRPTKREELLSEIRVAIIMASKHQSRARPECSSPVFQGLLLRMGEMTSPITYSPTWRRTFINIVGALLACALAIDLCS